MRSDFPSFSRLLGVSCVVLLDACGFVRRPGTQQSAAAPGLTGEPERQQVTFTTPVSQDSLLTLAANTLRGRGYTLGVYGRNTLATIARDLAPAVAVDSLGEARQWVLRIETDSLAPRQTQVRVAGYFATFSDRLFDVRVAPVTSRHAQLFGEIEATAAALREARAAVPMAAR